MRQVPFVIVSVPRAAVSSAASVRPHRAWADPFCRPTRGLVVRAPASDSVVFGTLAPWIRGGHISRGTLSGP